MRIHSSLTAYPIFRLTVFLAAGIFLSDRFLSDMFSWEYVFGCSVSFFVLSLFSFRTSLFPGRFRFGCLVSAAFFFLGGSLVLYERESVVCEWDSRPQLYWGLVDDVPHRRGKTMQAEVEVSYCQDVADTVSVKRRIGRSVLLSWIPDTLAGPAISIGDSICFYAKISRPVSLEEITGFDYGEYLMRQRIGGTGIAFAGNIMCTKKNELSFAQYALEVRQDIVELYRDWGLEGDVLAVVSALTIGDRGGLTPELVSVYNATGASHVLSLSGLHIAILAGILFFLFRPLHCLPYGRVCSSVFIVLFLWIFAFVSGLSSPVVRSVIMFSLYIVSRFMSKERLSGAFSVSLSAFLMLLYNPFYLFDISFQLSYVAVYSIILFYPLFARLINMGNRFVRYVWEVMSVSLAAQLGTFPLILFYFGAFPTYFLLANLVVSPLSACILGGALAALVLGAVPFVGDYIVWALEFSTELLNNSMRFVQQLSGSQLTSLYLSWYQVLLLFLLLGVIYKAYTGSGMKFARQPILILCILGVFLGTCLYERLRPSQRYLCFARSEVYTRTGRTLSLQCSEDGLFLVDSLRIGLMKSDRWCNKESDYRLPLDYLYICRGFKGSMETLAGLFEIRFVVLDSSLSDYYREKLVRECQLLKISYTDLSVNGSCLILL